MLRLKHIWFVMSVLLLTPHLLWSSPIKIGVAGPFSGPYVAGGTAQWRGVYQAIEDINEKGGINGHKLVIVIADDGCDATKAQAAARRLIKQQVVGVVGHNCSGASIVAEKIYHDANIVMITPTSTSPAVTENGYQNIFRTCGRDDSQAKIAAHYIVDKLKAQNIIIIDDATLYGKGLAQYTKDSLEQLGANIPFTAQITRGQKDYSELINQIKKTPAEVLYFGGIDTDAALLLRAIRDSKMKILFFSGDGLATTGFTQKAGGPQVVNGVYMTIYEPPASSDAKKVINTLRNNRVVALGDILNAYAATQAIAQAIEKSGSLDAKAIAQWLHQHKVDSVIGKLQWDKNGDLRDAPFAVYQWNDDGGYDRVD